MSSSLISPRKNDVFLSFRGTDTRRGFLSHLSKSLCDKRIATFIDYKLREGNEISSALLREIEESYISLIIFSKDYASSKWCLEELVKIIDCKEKNGQIVMPIFYDIDPSSVRNQKGRYGDALLEHEKKGYDTIKLQSWRAALKKAANLSGFHFSNFETEAELIEKVTKCLLIRLKQIMNQSDIEGIVGIHRQIADVELLLCTWSQDVRIIGIWGMGGIGKTTIANIIFNKLRNDYEGCHFLENVKERCEKYGITQVNNSLLTKLLDEDPHIIMHNGIPAYIKRRLCHKKILIVLDDVSDLEQLQTLIGGCDWFGPGSRIIITNRDKHVLSQDSNEIYNVKALNSDEALQLFNLNAFKGGNLETRGSELSRRVVAYANGIPLAIKILGSFLHGKSEEEWESELEKLEKMPCLKIQNVLKWSYDGLDEQEKDILLYLACFFKGSLKKRIVVLLNACGYSTIIGLRVLQNRALITISREESVSMHDLIQEMGRAIVREKSFKDPSKRSHLWDPNDIYRVLKNSTGADSIESIKLDISKIKELHLKPQAFSRMINLKFLELTCHANGDSKNVHKVHLSEEGLKSLSDELRSFHWKHYPLTFCVENLVEFYMPNSCVRKLWDGIQDLVNLREIDLSKSPNLMELPDLSKAQNLESVNLSSCSSLQHLHPSIFSNNKLIKLVLYSCKELKTLRTENSLRSLEHLNVQWCSSLKEFSVISEHMTYLNLGGTAIEELYSSIGNLNKLEILFLNECQYLKSLPLEVSELRSLKILNVSDCRQLETWNLRVLFHGLRCLEDLRIENCYNLTEIPDNISLLSSLAVLWLVGTIVKTLPASIKHLSQLTYIHLHDCKMLQSLPELPPFISNLDANNCTSLETVFTLDSTNDIADQPVDSGSIFYIMLQNCKKLDKHVLEAVVAENLNLRIKQGAYKHISASSWNYLNYVCFPGSKIPDCFSYRSTRQDLMLSATLELPSNSKLMGFVVCIVYPQMQLEEQDFFFQGVSCRFYLEEDSNGGRLEYEIMCPTAYVTDTTWDHVYMWYDGALSLEIMNDVERRRALDTDKCMKVWFQFFLEVEDEFVDKVREWGVCPMYVSELQNQLGSRSKRTWDVEDSHSGSEDESMREEDLHQSKKRSRWELPIGSWRQSDRSKGGDWVRGVQLTLVGAKIIGGQNIYHVSQSHHWSTSRAKV